jgi:hypothetical protein
MQHSAHEDITLSNAAIKRKIEQLEARVTQLETEVEELKNDNLERPKKIVAKSLDARMKKIVQGMPEIAMMICSFL